MVQVALGAQADDVLGYVEGGRCGEEQKNGWGGELLQQLGGVYFTTVAISVTIISHIWSPIAFYFITRILSILAHRPSFEFPACPTT